MAWQGWVEEHHPAAGGGERMRRIGFLTFSLVLAFLAIAFGNKAWASTAHSLCTPEFPPQTGKAHGWLGADAAYSIPLEDGRDLWIFGDTLEGKQRVVHAGVPKMVRNSIGISTCSAGRWKIEYHLRRDASGTPKDFFRAQHPDTWYWAMDGFSSGSDVWVTLLCVRATKANSAMGFESCGSDLAKIEAPWLDPQQWKITYYPLVADGVHAYPSATVVPDGDNVDLFAMKELGAKPLIAGRIAKARLNDPRANLEYLAADGEWKKGFEPEYAAAVMTPGSSELSIRYHPEIKRWLAVMFAPGGFSADIVLRISPSATGPWSKVQTIYTVPEMQPETAGYDKDTFCYAGKEHPEFERGDLVFTYVCNTFAVPKLATEMNIYLPRVVRMPMPEFEEHTAEH
jgi:Domain of unknown function (DUF4185)